MATILFFELLGAVFAYKLVELHSSSDRSALLAACAVIFAPTVIANGAWWGQCDMIWASLLLGALYFSMTDSRAAAVVLFGIAISIKAQAIFFAPFFLMLALRSELPMRYLLCVPLVYGVMMLPAIVLGQTPTEVMTVYLKQGLYFNRLSMNAPNLYYFVPDKYYLPGTLIGIVLATLVTAALAYLPRWTRVKLTLSAKVLGATMFVALVPFLLPKTHDRYFFAADLGSVDIT